MVLKKHTNKLLQFLADESYDLNSFELKRHHEGTAKELVEINYKGSPLSFGFRSTPGDFDLFKFSFVQFLPGYPEYNDNYEYSIEGIMDNLKFWLTEHLQKYLENENDIDYWKMIKENPFSVESIDFTKNEPFKLEEKKQLAIGLEEIKTLLAANFNLTQDQIQSTNRKIDYLIDATNRLNKTDWKGIAISTIFTIAYDMAFDDQKRGMLFGLFSKLWAVIQQLPGPVIL